MKKSHLNRLVAYIPLFVLVGLAIFPLYWMVATSLKPKIQTFAIPPVWVFKPTLIHYYTAIFEKQLARAFFNSLFVATLNALLSVFVGSLAAFSLARFNIRGKNHIWFWIITNRMLPPVVLVVPIFVIASYFKLLDTWLILILVYTTFNIPLATWIMVDFFRKIPRELDEAAMTDGCSHISAFFRIILPLSAPGLATSSIFCFIFAWNEFLFALILTRSDARTMPVLASTFMTGYGILWGLMCATGTMIALPIIVFCLIISKYLVRGLTLGAIK